MNWRNCRPTSERDKLLEEGLIEQYVKDREGHEHAPAGTSKGGQFVSTGVGDHPSTQSPKPKPTADQKRADSERRFRELMATKSPADAEQFWKARADGIAIPPAWTEVTYYGKDADILADGRDAKGRRQRVERPDYRQRISDENNARIARDLMPRMAKLRKQLRQDALSGNEEAKVLYLISITGFRIGGKGDGKAKTAAFGAFNLMGEHVTVTGDTVTFDFPGKKGVQQKHTVRDPLIVDIMKGAKPGAPVFQTRDTKVREAWQKRYGGAKVHDIRHVVATEMAMSELDSRIPPVPETKRDRDRLTKEVAQVVAQTLGNNRAQALNTYIDPQIWKVLEVK